MPDLASRSEAVTSSVLLPIEDTIPIPVTTTRRIAFSFTPLLVERQSIGSGLPRRRYIGAIFACFERGRMKTVHFLPSRP
jgi:hypothetical protein